MVDVAAIFDDVFGPGDQDQGVSKNRCARCVGVPEGHKSLENRDTLGTPSEASGHTSNQGVPDESERCAGEVVEKQELTAKVTKAHRAHRKIGASIKHPNPGAFEERAPIFERKCRNPDCTFRCNNLGGNERAGHLAKRAAEMPLKLMLENHR